MSSRVPKAQNNVAPAKVQLYTWGTHPDGGNGMAHYLDAKLMGGNVGHASVAVTFPAKNGGFDLIQKYCMHPDNDGTTVLPFQMTREQVKDKDGKISKVDMYTVYFSWWPAPGRPFMLSDNLNYDRKQERIGVNEGERDPRFGVAETRPTRGELGGRTNHLPPYEITGNLNNLSPDQKKLFIVEQLYSEISTNIETMELILKKLPDDGSTVKIEGTLFKLLEQQIPGWQQDKELKYDPKSKKLNAAQVAELKKIVNLRKQLLENDRKPVDEDRKSQRAAFQAEEEAKTREGVRQLRSIEKNDPYVFSLTKKARSDFPERVWLAYDLEEIDRKLEPLEKITNFINNFGYDETPAKNEILKNILFGKEEIPAAPGIPSASDLAIIRKNWRNLLPADKSKTITNASFTNEDFSLINRAARSHKVPLTMARRKVEDGIKIAKMPHSFIAGDYEATTSKGLSPDARVVLPVGGIFANERSKPGLNVERMLTKMNELARDRVPFDLNTKNCSVTTGAILAAGAEPELSYMLDEKAWGGFGNPQEVFNGAVKYQKIVTGKQQGKKSVGDYIEQYNPLNLVSWAGGSILRGLVDPDAGIATKVALGALAIPVMPLVGLTETAKALATPGSTFSNCTRFINYAWNNNSTVLKICSAPVALLAGVLAVPAGLQFASERLIIEPVRNALAAKKSQEIKAQDPHNMGDLPVPGVKERAVSVSNLSPRAAAAKAQQIAEEGNMPMLTPRTLDTLVAEAQKRPSGKKRAEGVIKAVKFDVPLPNPELAEKYAKYQKNVSIAQQNYPSANILLVSQAQFEKNPALLEAYGKKLKKDIRHESTTPTDFAKFSAHFAKKINEQSAKVHAIHKEDKGKERTLPSHENLNSSRPVLFRSPSINAKAPSINAGLSIEPIDYALHHDKSSANNSPSQSSREGDGSPRPLTFSSAAMDLPANKKQSVAKEITIEAIEQGVRRPGNSHH